VTKVKHKQTEHHRISNHSPFSQGVGTESRETAKYRYSLFHMRDFQRNWHSVVITTLVWCMKKCSV